MGQGSTTPQPGTQGYNQLNQALQVIPMQAATQMIGSGGMGPISQYASGQLAGMDPSNPWMNTAAQMFQGVGDIGTGRLASTFGNDPRSIGTGHRFGSIYAQAGRPGEAQSALQDISRGSMLEAGGNPYIEDIISRGQQDVSDQMAAMFGAGGRYGSGAHQGTVSEAVADVGNQLRGQNYENERARQMQAAGLISGEQAGRMGIQQGAAQGLTGVQQQNIANQLQASGLDASIANMIAGVQGQNVSNQLTAGGQLGQLGQQAYSNQQENLLGAAGLEQGGQQNLLNMISQLPTIQGNKIFDAQQQMQVGQQLDARSQALLNDLINRWTQGDMEEWARLGGLLTMGQGAAGNWGTQTSTTQGQSSQSGSPLGALGGLLSVFSLFSDRRMKTDIEPDGYRMIPGSQHDVPAYRFAYAFGIPSLMGKWRGVMAQDVPGSAGQLSGYLTLNLSDVLEPA